MDDRRWMIQQGYMGESALRSDALAVATSPPDGVSNDL
jgi:hypothetical protein